MLSGKLIFCFDDTILIRRRVLVVLDRITSSALGRPCALQDEEWVFTSRCDRKIWD